jgi:hypothetical protein
MATLPNFQSLHFPNCLHGVGDWVLLRILEPSGFSYREESEVRLTSQKGEMRVWLRIR